jgi:transposase InsO family protein
MAEEQSSTEISGRKAQGAAGLVRATVKTATSNESATEDDTRLAQKFDPVFKKKLRKLQMMVFKDNEDVFLRWPTAEVGKLEETDGVFEWEGYVIVPRDICEAVIAETFKSLPPATGRQKLSSLLKQRYIGPSNQMCADFLEANDDHQRFRQRRRSNLAQTSVPTAPYKVIQSDITYVPQVGTIQYVLTVADTWSKFLYTKALSSLEGTVVKAIEEIIQSWPPGVGSFALRTDNVSSIFQAMSIEIEEMLYSSLILLCFVSLVPSQQQGTEFKNAAMVEMLKKYDGKPVYARPGVPTSSGTIEGLNRVTKVNLYSELNRNGVLDKKVGSFIPALAKVTHAYNNTVSSSHGFIPAMINKPVDQLPVEVVKAKV